MSWYVRLTAVSFSWGVEFVGRENKRIKERLVQGWKRRARRGQQAGGLGGSLDGERLARRRFAARQRLRRHPHQEPDGLIPAGFRDDRLRRLEAILFLTREPLPSRKLSQYANLADATEARTLVRLLNQLFDEEGRSFRVEELAGGFQLLTRPHFAVWLRRTDCVPRESRLSPPAMETLAVVAYRQPTPRAEIEAIRGVSCGEILKQLMERDLVRIGGRSEELGRPYLYETTKKFLRVFGLKNLDGLPRVEAFRDADEKEGDAMSPDHTGYASDREKEEESQVAATITAAGVSAKDWTDEEQRRLGMLQPQCVEDDEEFEEDEEFEDDDEEFEDDDEFEDEDEFEDDEEIEEEEDDWEEVDDEEEDDEEWDDEEDEDEWDEDEEEEEEEDWED